MNRAALLERVHTIFNPLVMGLIALGVIPLILLDLSGNLDPTTLLVTTIADWAIVGVFLTEYVARLLLADSKGQFVLSPWNLLDLAIVVLPFGGLALTLSQSSEYNVLTASPVLRLLRVARVVALLSKSVGALQLHSTLKRNNFYHIAVATVGIYLTVSSVFYVVETSNGHNIAYADAMWWGVGYISTIGSEIISVTGVGRVLGGLLMITGLAFAGIFTANVIYFLQELRSSRAQKSDPSTNSPPDNQILRDLLDRQKLLENKVDVLLQRLTSKEQ